MNSIEDVRKCRYTVDNEALKLYTELNALIERIGAADDVISAVVAKADATLEDESLRVSVVLYLLEAQKALYKACQKIANEAHAKRLQMEGENSDYDPKQDAHFMRLIERGDDMKLSTIKYLREKTDWGFFVAKGYVELMLDQKRRSERDDDELHFE